MRTRSRTLGYRPDLDGVRAVAIIAVIITHVKLWYPNAAVYWGARGVDLFFVLSGFLITSLLYREHATKGEIHRGFFYARRALRLLPALALAIILGAVVTVILGGNGKGMLSYRHSAVAATFFAGNWFKWRLGVLNHTWSLGLEEQYYLIWPLVMGFGLRRMKSAAKFAAILGVAAVAIAGLGSAYNHHLLHVFWRSADLAPWDRASGILIGSALGLALASDATGRFRQLFRDPALPVAASMAIVGAIILSAMRSVRTPNDAYSYDLLLVLDASFALIIGHVFVMKSGGFARALRLQPLPAIGRISYGLYLYHWPIFLLVAAQKGSPAGLYALAIALSLAVATASYLVVERPILGLKGAMERRMTAPPSGLAWRRALPAVSAGARRRAAKEPVRAA